MTSPAMRLESDIPVYEMVCDLCLAPNSVRWTYVTDNNCTQEEWDANYRNPDHRVADGNRMFHQRDPRWGICQVCHELIQANNRKVLFGRMMQGHRDRKRTHLAEMLQSRRYEDTEHRDEIMDQIKRIDMMHEVATASPAMGMSFDLALASDLAALLEGFTTYRHPEVVAEPYTAVDRVLATRWQPYTSRGALPDLPMAVPDDAPDDAMFEIAMTQTRGLIPMLIDGDHR